MSASIPASALDALKAHAKQLLTLARAGDSTVIARLRETLPRLAKHTDAAFAAEVKLADIQHSVARQRGIKSWGELKRHLETLHPIHVQAQRFLHAVRESDAEASRALLDAFPDIARYNACCAAAACNDATLKALLAGNSSRATDPSPPTPNSATPIIYACGTLLPSLDPSLAAANTRCVELLLQHGANANSAIPWGEGESQLPALYFASVANNIDAVRVLLENGANPNDNESVPHAAERNHRGVLALLLAAGADVSSRYEEWGNTPLYFLAGYKTFSPRCTSSEQGMQWLLENGADPNVPSYVADKHRRWTSSGETPLHRVAEYGKGVGIASALVNHGANANAPRSDGKTPLALAVRSGNNAVASYLESVGASTEPLTAVDRLLGACVTGNTALAHGIVAQNFGILNTLNSNDRRALVLAVEENREDSVRLMVSLGFNLTDEGEWGGTPLHHAAWHGRPAMTRVLLELGAPVNVRDNQYGSSPLAWAAHGSVNGRPGNDDDYCAVVELLLDAGSTREASYNKWNEAPESMSSKAVAKLLRQRGFAA